jgi:hypothetical protein
MDLTFLEQTDIAVTLFLPKKQPARKQTVFYYKAGDK